MSNVHHDCVLCCNECVTFEFNNKSLDTKSDLELKY